MKNYSDKESECLLAFNELGACYHLWTLEDFEIIFITENDFKNGMGILAIAAKMFPDVVLLSFELMSNHLHLAVCGENERILQMFASVKLMLVAFAKAQGRTIDWSKFIPCLRELETLDDARTIIIYVNRNGYVVNPDSTPFSYRWGANRYYFNPDAKMFAQHCSVKMGGRERREISHSHCADRIESIRSVEGYATPMCFCNIESGERLFRDASSYFISLSKSMESNKKIAKEIGEQFFYNDDELYAVVRKIAIEKYDSPRPSTVNPDGKIALAKMMYFEYHATSKQITRILRVPSAFLSALGLNR